MLTEPAASARVAAVHGQAIVVNGLVGSTGMPAGRGAGIDVHRAMHDGGVTAANLTVALEGGFAATARRMVHVSEAVERAAGEGVRIARSADDVRAAKAAGEAAIVLGFQNAAPLEDRLEHLAAFHRLGLRILQLTYQRRNLLADGCGEEADAGLSVYGRQVIEECARLGVLVDLSHVGYRSTLEAIDASPDPVAFTHVNLQTFNPVPRNKSDEQIKALAARGGVVGINAIARLISPHGRQRGADLSEFLDQIDYVVQLVGIDHVGLGLDVNEGMTEEDFLARRKGFLTQYPELRMGGDFPFEHYYVRELTTMANLPLVTQGLLDRGYADADVLKVLGGNFMRVFEAAWTPAP